MVTAAEATLLMEARATTAVVAAAEPVAVGGAARPVAEGEGAVVGQAAGERLRFTRKATADVAGRCADTLACMCTNTHCTYIEGHVLYNVTLVPRTHVG